MRIKISSFSTVSVFLFITAYLLTGTNGQLYAQNSVTTHTIQQGETLFSIAQRYNVTVSELRQWNTLQADNLQPGSTLRVVSPDLQNSITHTVQPGETLYSLSRQYNVTIAEIQQWNNLNVNILDIGMQLTIYPSERQAGNQMTVTENNTGTQTSVVSDQTQRNTYYTVRSGDNLTIIARQHDMTIEELQSLNNLQSDILNIGQELIVRDSQSTPVVESGNEESTPQGKFVTYRLQSGENLSTVLNKFNMTRDELVALNPLSDVTSLASDQQVTVLLPPTRSFPNPYRKQAGLQNLGDVLVQRYSDGSTSTPTTSGELYNPEQLTAAHANMALGNIVYVENSSTGKGVYVKINDRHSGEGLKLSKRAYDLLDFSPIERPSAVVYLDEQ